MMTSLSVWASFTSSPESRTLSTWWASLLLRRPSEKKTWLLLFWPGPENKQQASSYFRNPTKKVWNLLLLPLSSHSSCCLGRVSLALPVDLPTLLVPWVTRAWCAFHLSWWLCLFLLHVLAFFVDPDARIIGDQEHEFARSAWCFPFRGSPRFMVAFTRLRHNDWRTCNDNSGCKISFAMWLKTPSRRSCRVHWQGSPVAGIKVECCNGLPCCVQCVCLARLWRLLLKTTSIGTIAISNDGAIACRCLSWLTLPSPVARIAFAARFLLVIY